MPTTRSTRAITGHTLALATLALGPFLAPAQNQEPDHRPDHRSGHAAFTEHPVDRYYWLNDFVLTDVNSDGLLDIACTNHALRPRIRLNQGAMRFVSPPPQSPFAFDAVLPQLIAGADAPGMTDNGVYVYHDGLWTRIVAKGLEAPAALVITDDAPIGKDHTQTGLTIIETRGVTLNERTTLPDGRTRYTLTLAPDAGLTLAPTQPTPRMFVTIDFPETIDPANIRIGPRAIPSPTHTITLDGFSDVDWHNTIWADFNNDAIPDVFVAQGGDNGQASIDPRVYNDRLILSSDQSPLAEDRAFETGIRKLGMPARGTMIADIDHNGLPDIYVRNARSQGANKPIRNTLHMQTAPLQFREQAQQYKLDITTPGIGAWFDPDADGWPDLLWADEHSIRLFVNKHTHFEPITIAAGITSSAWISIGDFDNDADLDAVVACWPTQLILINNDGRLDPVPATSLGLPKNFNAAQWIDADNDGKLDLYAPPAGLYLQTDNHRFAATNLLRTEPGWDPFAWGDLDNDGRPDLVRRTHTETELPTRTRHKDITGTSTQARQAPAYTLTAYRNQIENDNNWLDITLVGPAHNPNAIGATILLGHNGRQQLAMVGQQDSSQSSIGNYRIHFGLGAPDETKDRPTLTIRWPDGTTQQICGLAPNRLHIISQADGEKPASP